MTRLLRLNLLRLALAGLILCLSGCLDYREVLTLSAAGGGSLEAELTLDVGLVGELSAALGEALDEGELASPTRAEFESALTAEGVRVAELQVEEQGPLTWARFRIDFEDLDALHRLDAFSSRRHLALFDHGGGRVLVTSRLDPRGVVPQPGFGGALDPERASAVDDVVARIRAALRLESRLHLPGEVLSSNGELRGADEVSWSFDTAEHPGLGEGELVLQALVPAEALPWASELQPTPPEAGPSGADALAPVTSTTAPGATSAGAPGLAGRGRGGCSLTTQTQGGWGAALGLTLLGALLVIRRGP